MFLVFFTDTNDIYYIITQIYIIYKSRKKTENTMKGQSVYK